MRRKLGKLKVEEIKNYPDYLQRGKELGIYRSIERKAADWITQFVSKNSNRTLKVLDVGSGIGLLASHFARKARESRLSVEIIGVDKLKSMVQTARTCTKEEGLEELSFQEGDITSLPFPDNHFDLVIGTFFLFFLDDKDFSKFLKEINRVLVDKGMFYFLHGNRNRLIWLLTYLNTRNKKGYEVGAIEYSYTPEELKELFSHLHTNELSIKTRWLAFLVEVSGIVTKRAA